jgi:hypothetical protein
MHAAALERLEQGDMRDAAEKAWCATKRATDALALARTGETPSRTTQTSSQLRFLAHRDPRCQPLRTHYNRCISELHGDCFYDGHCEPEELIAQAIRETTQYIQNAEDLADSPA